MNKVIVKVVGLQRDAQGEENRIEMMSVGKHYYKNGINYVLYEDRDLGETEKTSTLLKIGEDRVTLIRKGSIVQEQYFEEAAHCSSVYRTPYGDFTLSVLTNKLEIDYGSVSGEIRIDYAMAVNGEWQSENRLQIHICADGAESNQMN